MKHLKTKLAVIGLAGMSLALVGCNEEKSAAAPAGVSPQKMADALFTVMEADRAVYLPHPDHKAFGAVLGPHLDDVLVLDYWTK